MSEPVSEKVALGSAPWFGSLRWLRWIHGTILGWLYRGEDWRCSCGAAYGGWGERCGCARAEPRPAVSLPTSSDPRLYKGFPTDDEGLTRAEREAKQRASHNPGVKALLSGGPAEGLVEAQVTSRDGRVWTINVVHVNCACEWCAKVEGAAVEHVYERRDDDLFAYRESREPSDAA